jgi:hypothetical protein
VSNPDRNTLSYPVALRAPDVRGKISCMDEPLNIPGCACRRELA